MMRLAVGFLLFISVGSTFAADNVDPGLCGTLAPMVVLKTLDGKEFYLRDYCGQPRGPRHRQERDVLVFSFFTSWCKNCKLEIPVLQEMASELSSQGVKIFLINVGEARDTVENFVFQNVVTLPVLMDQYEVALKKYKVKELPTLVMIDRDGVLKEYHTGFIPAYGDSIKFKIYSLLGMGQTIVKPDSTKSDPAQAAEKTTLKKNKTNK